MVGSSAKRKDLEKTASLVRQIGELAAGEDHAPAVETQLLAVGCELFDLEIGIVARVKDESFRVVAVQAPPDVEIEPGTAFYLEDTFSSQTIAANGPVHIRSAKSAGLKDHPAHRSFGLQAYLHEFESDEGEDDRKVQRVDPGPARVEKRSIPEAADPVFEPSSVDVRNDEAAEHEEEVDPEVAQEKCRNGRLVVEIGNEELEVKGHHEERRQAAQRRERRDLGHGGPLCGEALHGSVPKWRVFGFYRNPAPSG